MLDQYTWVAGPRRRLVVAEYPFGGAVVEELAEAFAAARAGLDDGPSPRRDRAGDGPQAAA